MPNFPRASYFCLEASVSEIFFSGCFCSIHAALMHHRSYKMIVHLLTDLMDVFRNSCYELYGLDIKVIYIYIYRFLCGIPHLRHFYPDCSAVLMFSRLSAAWMWSLMKHIFHFDMGHLMSILFSVGRVHMLWIHLLFFSAYQ